MKHPYWHYFIALSEDVERTTRFVEPSLDNFRTYSIEFTRLYLAIGSETDVAAKLLCEKINPKAKLDGIDTYRAIILAAYPDVPSIRVTIPRHEILLTPWKDWGSGVNPLWWKNHNAVKHTRHKFFAEANLENTLNALGGLMILAGYLYAEDLGNCRLSPSGNFILFDSMYYGGVALGKHGNVAGYWLPGIPRPKRR